MKKIITLILCMSVAIVLGIFSTIALAANNTTSEDNIPSETSTDVELSANKINKVKTNDKEKAEQLLIKSKQKKKAANQMKKSAEVLKHDSVIELAEKEISNAQEEYEFYQQQYDKILKKEEFKKWDKRYKEYPSASRIWQFLKSNGYNDYVCAGIMGNLMTEVGGQTLNLQCMIYGDGYYGMCQWNPRHTKVFGKGINGQCEYLLSTIEKEFNTYGSNYASGFNYNSFKNMNNEQNAAIACAKVYERCASASYYQRAANAAEAYNYLAD